MKKSLSLLTLLSMLLLSIPISKAEVSAQAKQKDNKTEIINNANTADDGRFALLVGINKYEDRNITSLNGCENDVRLMKDLLMGQYKFTENEKDKKNSNIKTLLSAEATHDAIESAFKVQLINKAEAYFTANKLNKNTRNKGATIVFYYSGHGATLPDVDEKTGKLTGEEPDGLDETIVPYNSRQDGTNAIRDDKFQEFYNTLSEFTTNITFIFDSCHSGTATRAPGGIRRTEFTKAKMPDELKNENAKSRDGGDAPILTDAINNFGKQSDDLAGYVTLSGSSPNQLSQERLLKFDESAKEDYNGLLTFYLVKQLKENPGGSYSDIMTVVKKAVTGKNPAQEPQLEGDVYRPVFNIAPDNGKRLNRKAIKFESTGEVVTEKDTNKKLFTIKMDAGKVVGALEGGIIAIYSKDALSLTGESERIGNGTITKADDFTSTVKVVLKDNKSNEVPKEAQISLVTPYFGTAKKVIALDTSSLKKNKDSEAVLKKVVELSKGTDLEPQQFYETKEILNPISKNKTIDNRNWDAAVVRMTFSEFRKGKNLPKEKSKPAKDDKTAETVPDKVEDVYVITDVNGDVLYNFYTPANDPTAAIKINEALVKHTRVENLRSFGNEIGGLSEKIKLEFVPIENVKFNNKKQCEYSEKSNRLNKEAIEVINPGQAFYLRMTNDTGEDLHMYLYSISPEGAIKSIYPVNQPGLKIPDEKVTNNGFVNSLISNGCPYLRIESDREGKGGSGDVKPFYSYGVETYKLIAASSPINPLLLESPPIGKSRGGTPLEQLFSQVSSNSRDGTEFYNDYAFSGWATTSISVEIVPKRQ